METRPVSTVMAIAAYQMPVARDFHPGMGGHSFISPPAAPDSVEISAEARKRASQDLENLRLWGEVRYDYPHNDDPDFPWEVQHQQWTDLIAKVFRSPQSAEQADDAQSP